jgi:hypothetical protein
MAREPPIRWKKDALDEAPYHPLPAHPWPFLVQRSTERAMPIFQQNNRVKKYEYY